MVFIVVRADASLIVVNEDEARLCYSDDVYGPFLSYQDAYEAAAHAEWDLFAILSTAGFF